VAFVIILLAESLSGWAAPQPQARSIVTYPADGMVISGAVDVIGIATHPNMQSYQLRYAAGPQPTGNSQWVDFAIVEGTQMEDGVLGTWDTTTVPSGQYTLALAVWGLDDAASPYVFFVMNLTVDNSQPIETPTPEPLTPEPLPTAVVGPTPTPVQVEQPATPTPRPSPTSRSEVIEETATPSTEEEGIGEILDIEKLNTAFCSGGRITVLLFSLWGLYLLAKVGVRWFLRRRTNVDWK
jgi:hypothetical protein